jgi:hypothetical protein
VTVRATYGDAIWRLAVAGDSEALRSAADRLLTGDASYEGNRARAFALAVDGRLDAALAELAEGRLGDWPFPAAYAADSARVRHLGGDDEGALRDLAAAAREADRLDPEVPRLAAEIVRRSPSLHRRALRLVVTTGTIRQRVRNAAAIAAARSTARTRAG